MENYTMYFFINERVEGFQQELLKDILKTYSTYIDKVFLKSIDREEVLRYRQWYANNKNMVFIVCTDNEMNYIDREISANMVTMRNEVLGNIVSIATTGIKTLEEVNKDIEKILKED